MNVSNNGDGHFIRNFFFSALFVSPAATPLSAKAGGRPGWTGSGSEERGSGVEAAEARYVFFFLLFFFESMFFCASNILLTAAGSDPGIMCQYISRSGPPAPTHPPYLPPPPTSAHTHTHTHSTVTEAPPPPPTEVNYQNCV